MRGAGCVVNDLWDRNLDSQVERTRGRPLASGAIKPWQAILSWLPSVSSVLWSCCCSIARRKFSGWRRWRWSLCTRWPNASPGGRNSFLGCVFGWGAPMGYAAAAGHLAWPALPLYLGTILWIFGYDTIYAHQDREDDALIGVKSTARLFGANTSWLLAACYAGLLLLLAVAMALSGLHAAGYWLLLAPAATLAWQIIRLDINDPARCLSLFKLNRETGLLIALAIVAGRL